MWAVALVRLHVKCPLWLSDFNQNRYVSTNVIKNPKVHNLTKICPTVLELLHAERCTDIQIRWGNVAANTLKMLAPTAGLTPSINTTWCTLWIHLYWSSTLFLSLVRKAIPAPTVGLNVITTTCSPPSEFHKSLSCWEIPHLWWNSTVHYCVQNNLPPNPVRSYLKNSTPFSSLSISSSLNLPSCLFPLQGFRLNRCIDFSSPYCVLQPLWFDRRNSTNYMVC
jgi:hypothetical protein